MNSPAGQGRDPLDSGAGFVILPENRLAYTAVTRWPDPTQQIPLLILYGTSGIGKSHLVRYALNLAQEKNLDWKQKHLTASTFAAELAEASEARGIARFQKQYRTADLLVIEDLQGIERRPETQQQLVSLLDEFLKEGKPLLLTSRKPVGELEGFSARFISRCHGGLIVPLRKPGPESRRLLWEHFAKKRHLLLPEEVLTLLATKCDVSPREIQGILLQIENLARQSRKLLDVALVKRFLDTELPQVQLNLKEIARITAQHFGVPLARLRSAQRDQTTVVPRQCAMLLARELTSEHLESIGKFFGGRDHSTVVRACQRLQSQLGDDPELRRHLQQLRAKLGHEA